MKTKLLMSLVFGTAFAISVFGQTTQDENANKVMAAIADFTLLRDDVQQRYAVFIVSELHSIKKTRPPRILEHFAFRAANRPKNFLAIANAHMLDRREGDPQSYRQAWTELVRSEFDAKVRYGTILGPYVVKQKGESITDFVDRKVIRLDYIEPFDDLMIHPMFFFNPGPNDHWVENTYLKNGKLLSVELGAQGNLISKWKYDERGLHYDIELTQSAAFAYMPIELKFTSRMPDIGDNFGHTRIQWKKVVGFDRYLPYRCESAYSIGSAFTEQFSRFHWKIGKQVGDEVFDFNSNDNRLPLTKLFGDFQVDIQDPKFGLIRGTDFETISADLVADEPDAKQ